MKYPYIAPTITKVEVILDAEVSATSNVILPGNSNNEVEVEDWDESQELNDTISW